MQPAADCFEAELQERLGIGAWKLNTALRSSHAPQEPDSEGGTDLTVPVISNVHGVGVIQEHVVEQAVSAAAPSVAAAWARLMARQIVEPVHWLAIMQRFWPSVPPDRHDSQVDCACPALLAIGPGRMLAGLAPASADGARSVICIDGVDDMRQFLRDHAAGLTADKAEDE